MQVMQKSVYHFWLARGHKNIIKTLLVMKLTFLLLTTAFLNVYAHTTAQTITLSERNISLGKVFAIVEKQTGYVVFTTKGVLSGTQPVSVSVYNMPLIDFLAITLKSQPLNYKITDKTILLTKKLPEKKLSAVLLHPVEDPILPPPVDVTVVVQDSAGQPLEGASIRVKGTQKGNTTDVNGHAVLKAVTPKSVLVVSFTGYNNTEITIGNNKIITIRLTILAQNLNDVVVIAYGTQKKETVTGAIASISTSEIKQSPAANLAVTLAGRLPGLTTIQSTGEPGNDATSLYLRGQGTTNGQTPLIMVDGVERQLAYIDPNEVASVTILKDASSTALFGVRGANGVILVTTKRGGTGDKPEINFSAEYGLEGFTRHPDPVNSYEYASLKNQASINDGSTAPYSNAVLQHYKLQDEPSVYPDNNWRKILSNDFTFQQRYNLNVSGGGRVRYFVNAGYLYQNGQWKVDQKDYDPTTFYKRYNFRSNIDMNLNKTLKAFLNVAGYLEKTNSQNEDQYMIVAYMNGWPANVPGPVDPSGNVIATTKEGNVPYGLINRSGYRQGTNSNVTASFGFEQDLGFITKGLSAKVMGSFDSRANYTMTGSANYTRDVQVIGPTVSGKDTAYYQSRGDGNTNTNLSLSTGTSFQTYSNFQFLLNYNRTFGNHVFTGLLLAQRDNTIQPGDPIPYKLIGFANRLTYGYKGKYLAEFNAGYNGSEQFASGHRFGFFPSVSGSWVVSKENFLKDNRTLSLLKLRASYGSVGNDNLSSTRFLYLDNTQVAGGGYSSSLGLGQTVAESYEGNSNLKWEVAKKMNLGLELELWKELKLIVDVFNEKRDNVLISRQTVPEINGLPSSALPVVNMGKVHNHGYEIELNYNKSINKNFSVLSKLNLSYAKNKILFFDEPIRSSDYAYRYRETGYSIGQPFGYVIDKYFTSQKEIDSYAKYAIGTPRPGDFKYKDVNGDGVINDKDLAPIGYPTVPQYTFGASFSIRYKDFDISLLFQGVAHVSKYMAGWGMMEGNNYFKNMLSAWTLARYQAGLPINYPALSLGENDVSNGVQNTFFTQNASYIRLKNFEVGYTFPVPWDKRIGAKTIRIYANALNPITWDKMLTKAFDPEQSSNYSYPIVRVFNFGANIIF